jgi:hypothetical protein
MVSDHTKALDASKHVASAVHSTLPDAVDAPTNSVYDDLWKKSGRDFDSAYLDAMVGGHEAPDDTGAPESRAPRPARGADRGVRAAQAIGHWRKLEAGAPRHSLVGSPSGLSDRRRVFPMGTTMLARIWILTRGSRRGSGPTPSTFALRTRRQCCARSTARFTRRVAIAKATSLRPGQSGVFMGGGAAGARSVRTAYIDGRPRVHGHLHVGERRPSEARSHDRGRNVPEPGGARHFMQMDPVRQSAMRASMSSDTAEHVSLLIAPRQRFSAS